MRGIDNNDKERSAQFFYKIIEHFGEEKFFKSFYVTNISWLGFVKNGKNINYYQLPQEVKELIFKIYQEEIAKVNPTTIISLSGEVQKTNKGLFTTNNIDVSASLPHPNYCAFPKNIERTKEQYISVLSQYIKE